MDEKLEFWTNNLIEASFEETPTPPEKPGWKTELIHLLRERSSVDVLAIAAMVAMIAMTGSVVAAKEFTWTKFMWCVVASAHVMAIWLIAARSILNENRTQKIRPN